VESTTNLKEFIQDKAVNGEPVAEEITSMGAKLLKSFDVSTEQVSAILKRDLKTRKVKVLAYEEWSDGVWVKHVSEFKTSEGKRGYNPRVRYSRPDSVLSIEN